MNVNRSKSFRNFSLITISVIVVYLARYCNTNQIDNYGNRLIIIENGQIKTEKLWTNGFQDGTHKEWFENGKLSIVGQYKLNEPINQWTYYYFDGREKSIEEVKGGVNHVMAFWLSDPDHTQTIIDGTGEL